MKETAPYQLVALLNERNERAFYTVFRQLYPSILSFANKFVGDTNIAQEVCSDSFIKLYQSNEVFDELNNVKAYLITITKNGCRDALRKVKRQTEIQKELLHILEANEQKYFTQKEIESELVELIYEAIEKLPTRCRRVFKMNLSGMSYEEIAEALQVSVNTIRNQKARGLKLLKISILKERGLSVSSASISVVLLELLSSK